MGTGESRARPGCHDSVSSAPSPRSAGLILVILVQMLLGLLPALVTRRCSLLVGVGPIAYRNRAGRNGWQIFTANVMWLVGTRKRQNVYRSGVAGPDPVRLAPAARTACPGEGVRRGGRRRRAVRAAARARDAALLRRPGMRVGRRAARRRRDRRHLGGALGAFPRRSWSGAWARSADGDGGNGARPRQPSRR